MFVDVSYEFGISIDYDKYTMVSVLFWSWYDDIWGYVFAQPFP